MLAKSGNAADQAQAAQLEQQSRIQADNVGHKCAPQLICQRATCLQAAAPTCCISLGPQMAPPLSCSGLCTQSCSVALASACNSGGMPAARLLQAGGAVTDTRGASLPCRLLSKMGWKEGSGLGASATGMAAPIAASGASSEKRGLGAEQHGQINEGAAHLLRCVFHYTIFPLDCEAGGCVQDGHLEAPTVYCAWHAVPRAVASG